MEVLNALSCLSADIIQAKSIFNPTTSDATMTALSNVSMLSTFVGVTRFCTNNRRIWKQSSV